MPVARSRKDAPQRTGAAVRVAGDRHDPAVRLHERLVAGVLRLGAASAEGGDRGVDEPRVDRRDVGVAEPEPLHVPGLEVLHQHVGGHREVAHDRGARRVLEVDGDALLVGVEGEERRAHAVLVGRPLTAFVPAEVLHLDDLGPEEGEQHRAVRSGEHPGAVEHPDPGEGGVRAGRFGAVRGIGHGRGSDGTFGDAGGGVPRGGSAPPGRSASKHTKRGQGTQSGRPGEGCRERLPGRRRAATPDAPSAFDVPALRRPRSGLPQAGRCR